MTLIEAIKILISKYICFLTKDVSDAIRNAGYGNLPIVVRYHSKPRAKMAIRFITRESQDPDFRDAFVVPEDLAWVLRRNPEYLRVIFQTLKDTLGEKHLTGPRVILKMDPDIQIPQV